MERSEIRLHGLNKWEMISADLVYRTARLNKITTSEQFVRTWVKNLANRTNLSKINETVF